jgi:lysophospholipase L1-like esterase
MRLLRRIGPPVLLMTLSSLLVLALAEVGLRLFRPVQYLKPPRPARPEEQGESLYRPSRVPGLSYEMIPGRDGTFEGMSVRTNSLGMRGPEPAPSDPSLFRVAVVGDSFTFGFGVREEETYPSLLARILNQSPAGRRRRFEVLNFGVVGYNTQDEAVVLERKALPLAPRLVIIGYVLNDPEIDPRPSLHKYFDPPVWWRHSHVLRLLHLGWNSIDVWIDGGGDYLRYLHAPGGKKWRSVVAAFGKIGALTRERDTRVLVVVFPMIPTEEWAGYPYRDLHQQVAQAARAERFEVVDLLPVFLPVPPRDLRVSGEDGHPNALGHDLAARAIGAALLAGDAIPPDRGAGSP